MKQYTKPIGFVDKNSIKLFLKGIKKRIKAARVFKNGFFGRHWLRKNWAEDKCLAQPLSHVEQVTSKYIKLVMGPERSSGKTLDRFLDSSAARHTTTHTH